MDCDRLRSELRLSSVSLFTSCDVVCPTWNKFSIWHNQYPCQFILPPYKKLGTLLVNYGLPCQLPTKGLGQVSSFRSHGRYRGTAVDFDMKYSYLYEKEEVYCNLPLHWRREAAFPLKVTMKLSHGGHVSKMALRSVHHLGNPVTKSSFLSLTLASTENSKHLKKNSFELS